MTVWRAACQAHLLALPSGTPLCGAEQQQQSPAGFATEGQQVSLFASLHLHTRLAPLLRRQNAALEQGLSLRHVLPTPPMHLSLSDMAQAKLLQSQHFVAVQRAQLLPTVNTAGECFTAHTRGAFVLFQRPSLASASGHTIVETSKGVEPFAFRHSTSQLYHEKAMLMIE